ncbi:UvrD-helicase domain-containing protein [Absiella sp. AM22-9]|uniref:UvrD-helicase domain-containing protein n=1 Tax=Absiella sp. AM22-9 TaxID=2291996 RepID=UPI000E40BC84|nr:UvrD-helicase domain-containing protein [Absiella sp. AM22-9]RGB58687.1 helicase [Absiella sp. AM22-9]
MPTWNKQQLAAITTKEKNILVSASAGSGKTTVLVARLMDLVLKDHIAIDEILAMTFTEAAANEMKKRLAKELQTAWQDSKDEAEKKFLSRQLSSLSNAYISTIHSFCLSIIQKYYYMIGLDHERVCSIMDNGAMTLYQQQALDEALQIQYQKHDEIFLTLCQMFSSRPEDMESLSSMIMQLATLASSKPDPDEWLDHLHDAYSGIKHIEDLPVNIYHNFFEYLYVEEQRYEEALHHMDEIYRIKYPNEVKKIAVLETKLRALSSIKEPIQNQDYEGFRSAFIAICHGIVPTSPEKEDKEYARVRKQINDMEDKLLSLLFREEEFISDLNKLCPVIEKLVEITKTYRKNYEAIKEKNKQIDFDDMEHFALAILDVNDHAVADIYRQQFKQIMVDEFQDSNDVQNALVMRICTENNVFRVGDIKQSIYGFRHAKPQLMKGLIDHKGIHDEVIYLSNNYRSKEMIVEFNNELFKLLMNMDGFDCSYSAQDDVATGVPAQKEDNVPICFHTIFHNEIKEANDLILSKNDFKASYIANQILEIKEKEHRKWKDFVVLVRGNARKDDMKSVFDELNIPYFIDIKYGFYQSNAVQIMLSALQSLYAPHEDIPFVATMLSPLFMRTNEELAQIKLMKEKYASYYSYYHEHPFPGFERFEELRKKRNVLRLSEMLNALYDINDYYVLHTTIQEKTNLDLLYEKAIAFEEDNACGIPSFLSRIAQIKDAQTAEAIPIGSDADVVRVMSIHQSKGLQFPVVFLWSTDRMTPIEFKEYCIADADLGIAMKAMDLPQRYVRTTIPRIAMEHKKDKEELEEEMRILYVATTRAQQQMHIVDCIQALEDYKKPLTMSGVYDRGGYTSWILQSFLTHPSALFTIKEVHQMWENIPVEKEVSIYQEIPHYHKTHQPMKFSSATSITSTEELPAFQPKSGAGMSYGTRMHHMIEHLPNTSWDKEIITSCAKDLQISLKEYDITSLLQLGNHPFYQSLFSKTCYHELPFMVKIKDEILHGFMDFVAMDDTFMTIIDFKTDRLDTPEEFIKLYRSQLSSYQDAMRILYPDKTCETYIYAFHLRTFIQIK